jgi:hypothetical protein
MSPQIWWNDFIPYIATKQLTIKKRRGRTLDSTETTGTYEIMVAAVVSERNRERRAGRHRCRAS